MASHRQEIRYCSLHHGHLLPILALQRYLKGLLNLPCFISIPADPSLARESQFAGSSQYAHHCCHSHHPGP